jgi:uncharacterized protein
MDPRRPRPFSRPTGAEPGRASAHPSPVEGENQQQGEHSFWQDRSRIFLQPIAAPSILGMFGLATATLMVGAWMARWYGTALTPMVLAPFVLFAGGLAQFMAGMWSYRARDGLATAVHGIWGAFWLAFGLFFLLIAMGALPVLFTPRIGLVNQPFAFWFVMLCIISGLCAVAALAENLGMAAVTGLLSLASGFTAAGFFSGAGWPVRVAGWIFVIASVAALYVATAMMMENTSGRTILPLGRYRGMKEEAAHRMARPLDYRHGEPGVKIGQ